MSRRRLTIDDAFGTGNTDKFSVVPDKKTGKPRVIKKKPCGCGKLQVCKICFQETEKENGIENAVLELLEKVKRCLAYKTPTKGRVKGNIRIKAKRFEKVGKSDIVVCLWGFYIAVEVKKPGEKQRPDQKEFEYEVLTSGGEYWLIESIGQLEKKIFEFKLKHNINQNVPGFREKSIHRDAF